MGSAADFTHVVMTRFNLAAPGRQSSIRNRPGWLAERFDLFERYCLPTMASQTLQDFQWIIYFDEETPAPFRDRIEMCRRIRGFTPYYTPLFAADGWPRSLRESIAAPKPWLLTTRLDNDDGLACDFVEQLHATVSNAPAVRSAFNFTNGFVMHGPRLYAMTHHCNPFASWLEPWNDDMRTAPSIHHMHLAEHGPVIQINGAHTWLQVVHGGNVSNRVRGKRVDPSTIRGRFPAETLAQLGSVSTIEMAFENVMMTPLRQARDEMAEAFKFLRRRLLGKGDVF